MKHFIFNSCFLIFLWTHVVMGHGVVSLLTDKLDDIKIIDRPVPQHVHSSDMVVFKAKEVVTLDEAMPIAHFVAVKDGTICAVAQTIEEVERALSGQKYRLDTQFENDVLVPGFYESHTHPHILGYFWDYLYVGRFARMNPRGHVVEGCATTQEILDRIRDWLPLAQQEGHPLIRPYA